MRVIQEGRGISVTSSFTVPALSLYLYPAFEYLLLIQMASYLSCTDNNSCKSQASLKDWLESNSYSHEVAACVENDNDMWWTVCTVLEQMDSFNNTALSLWPMNSTYASSEIASYEKSLMEATNETIKHLQRQGTKKGQELLYDTDFVVEFLNIGATSNQTVSEVKIEQKLRWQSWLKKVTQSSEIPVLSHQREVTKDHLIKITEYYQRRADNHNSACIEPKTKQQLKLAHEELSKHETALQE